MPFAQVLIGLFGSGARATLVRVAPPLASARRCLCHEERSRRFFRPKGPLSVRRVCSCACLSLLPRQHRSLFRGATAQRHAAGAFHRQAHPYGTVHADRLDDSGGRELDDAVSENCPRTIGSDRSPVEGTAPDVSSVHGDDYFATALRLRQAQIAAC